jgi:RNA polymerase sigma-70 factor, ECF subfamily
LGPGKKSGYNAAEILGLLDGTDVTRLLLDWKSGNQDARDELIPLVYGELRQMAARYLRNERDAHTLRPTVLVHEAYMRLVQHKLPDWESRRHFLGVAAHLMRQILVEHARRHNSLKRGQGMVNVQLNEALSFAPERSSIIVRLDDALTALAEVDERKSKIIELRFFGGLSVEEVAETLDISVATVGREQRLAEAWLHREIRSESD